MTTKAQLDALTRKILGCAIEVHKALGPGLLERVYHKCLKRELSIKKLTYASEFLVPIHYKGVEVDAELRCDFLIEDKIVVELKAVDALAPVFEAQLLTYMKLLEKPKGILINFNCSNIFRDGQRTYVNEYFTNLPSE
jgi:GxxExxY protein